MRCRYCENDDVSLLELTDCGDLYCVVCSRVSHPKRATAGLVGMPPPIPPPAGPGPLDSGPGRHGRKGRARC